jgi:phospholipase C
MPWRMNLCVRFWLAAVICGGFAQAQTERPVPAAAQGIQQINHIIFMAQENRSFDHYFGAMRQYWAQNGYPDQSFDGLRQFNPTSGARPLHGAPPYNLGCDPSLPAPNDCTIDSLSPKVKSFKLLTQCSENTSPSWNESHVDWDLNDYTGLSAAKMNGYVYTAAHDARVVGFFDTDGRRAMGYYDGSDLNYYYFMASNFATSDRWFSPVMSRTHPNREYLIAGTSQGTVYPIGSNSYNMQPLTATTIFQLLQTANISWKIYVNPTNSGCVGPPFAASCLLESSYVKSFQWGQTIPASFPNNIGTIGIPNSDFDNDLKNGTLPQVVQIEPAGNAGLDEHPTNSDQAPSRTQFGAAYVASIINSVMASSSWKDSAFILTYDEAGGLYDHAAPRHTVSPDGIKPRDLVTGDICTQTTGPTCDFVYTGYRVPLLVISPFARKNYVSHTKADFTAILKLIETRFGLPTLTQRDAAQMDMSEFFDFANPPWLTPPSPPVQNTSDLCYLDVLP